MRRFFSLLCVALLTLAVPGLVTGQVTRLKPGLHTITLEVGGKPRSYVAAVPYAYVDGTPIPLVVVLHGTGGNGEGMLQLGHFRKYAN
jgi:poly(3-hydroxybutyrate) depolymerase